MVAVERKYLDLGYSVEAQSYRVLGIESCVVLLFPLLKPLSSSSAATVPLSYYYLHEYYFHYGYDYYYYYLLLFVLLLLNVLLLHDVDDVVLVAVEVS